MSKSFSLKRWGSGWVKYTWKFSDSYNESIAYTAPGFTGSEGQPGYAPLPDGCVFEYESPFIATRTVGVGTTSQLAQSFQYTTSFHPERGLLDHEEHHSNDYRQHFAPTTSNQIPQANYDAAGNLLNDGMHTYTYDAESRISSVENATAYYYDALGQRVSSEPVGQQPTIDFLYDTGGTLVTTGGSNFLAVRTSLYAAGQHWGDSLFRPVAVKSEVVQHHPSFVLTVYYFLNCYFHSELLHGVMLRTARIVARSPWARRISFTQLRIDSADVNKPVWQNHSPT